MKNYLLLAFVLYFSIITVYAQPYLNENSTWQQNLVPVIWASLAFGDIDNDGDLDLAVFGCIGTSGGGNSCGTHIAKIYLNNGTSLIENYTWQQNLTNLNRGSITWIDIDKDGDLDLILTGCSSGGGASICNANNAKVYINNGEKLTENNVWQQNLVGVFYGSVAAGDIDNDGDLDLLMTGAGTSSYIAKTYINNGITFQENYTWQQNLPPVYKSSVTFGDIDSDGDLDLILTGDSGTITTKVYTNNGIKFVENFTWGQNLLNVNDGAVTLGDYDNDGDLDLTFIGHTGTDKHRIYENNGTTFVERQREIPTGGNLLGIFDGSVAFGDYDNDGDLDLIAMGYEGYTTIYKNINSNFTDSGENLLDVEIGPTTAWGDVNNDGDLDVVLTGFLYQGVNELRTKVYTNNITIPNTAPSPPAVLNSAYSNGKLSLSWNSGSDSQTPSSGLYYNLRVGTCSGCHNVVSGVYGGSSNPTAGYFGNMMQRKAISLNYPVNNDTIFYWAVQTIDTGLKAGAWSAEQVYSVDMTKPTITLASPSNGSVSSSSGVMFTYKVADVGIANCSLIIGNSTDVDTTITTETYQTFTKQLSNGEYNWSISCTDNWSYSNTSATHRLTVSYAAHTPAPQASSTGGSSSGGGGGGSSSSPAVTSAPAALPTPAKASERKEEGTIVIPEIKAGEKKESIIASDSAIGVITIAAKSNANNVVIEIRNVASAAAPPKDKVYQYVEISKQNISNESLAYALVDFKVGKSWILANAINKTTVALNRHSGAWEKLQTTLVKEDNAFAYYQAFAPSLSLFAITGEEIKAIEIIADTTKKETAAKEGAPQDNLSIPAISLAAVLAIGLYWAAKRKQTKVLL